MDCSKTAFEDGDHVFVVWCAKAYSPKSSLSRHEPIFEILGGSTAIVITKQEAKYIRVRLNDLPLIVWLKATDISINPRQIIANQKMHEQFPDLNSDPRWEVNENTWHTEFTVPDKLKPKRVKSTIEFDEEDVPTVSFS